MRLLSLHRPAVVPGSEVHMPVPVAVRVDVVCCRCSHWFKFDARPEEKEATPPCCPRCYSANTQMHWPAGC
jgi:hypothetical protein